MASFDIVSEPNMSELDNALNQARMEVNQRYDFKGVKTEIGFDKEVLTLVATGEDKLQALIQVVHQKLIKRGVSLNYFDFQKLEPAGGQMVRQKAVLKKGIERDKAKEINKIIKDSKLKVQSQVQGDQVRVTGKKIDDLQTAIATLKEKDLGMPLQFINFRS